ncbi:MAG: hypothetical protein QW542_05660 [Thermoproteota archaeon]
MAITMARLEKPEFSVKCPHGLKSFEERLRCEYPDCPKEDECVAGLGFRRVEDPGLWPKTDYVTPFESVEDLWSEVRSYIHEHLDLIGEEEGVEDVLTACVFFSYRVEEFDTTPYLYFIGPPDSGKSRALEVLRQLCYRGVFSGNISTAALFRLIDQYYPVTLLIDETETYMNMDRGKEVQLLLNSGYRKEGGKAIRCEANSKGEQKLKAFNVYGFKALAGNGVLLPTLLSRCIPIHMERKTRKVRLFLDVEKAQQLRGKLSFYQFHHSSDSEDVSVSEEKLEALGGSRLAELFHPLMKMAPTREIQETIFGYALKLAGKRKEEESVSDEAIVLKAIAELWKEGQQSAIPVREIVGKIQEIGDISSDKEKERWFRRVGWITKRLGFEKTRLGKGEKAVRIDLKLLRRLMSRYLTGDLPLYFPEGDTPTLEKTSGSSGTSVEGGVLENGLKQAFQGEISSNLGNLPRADKHQTEVFEDPEVSPQTRKEGAYEHDLENLERLKALVKDRVKTHWPLPVGDVLKMLENEGLSEGEAGEFLLQNLADGLTPCYEEEADRWVLIPLENYADYVAARNKARKGDTNMAENLNSGLKTLTLEELFLELNDLKLLKPPRITPGKALPLIEDEDDELA